MYTLLALLEIQKLGIFVANSLDPASMFLLLIRNIHFDTQVVVDWLQSETVAIPFLLRFFKAISKLSKEAMLEKLSSVNHLFERE
uniref:Protein Lines N-terminal domain-containing protein n=1 Tax=Ditylenchus dipsaci TaxID=166011 RepID=A0A915E9W0_9BILA